MRLKSVLGLGCVLGLPFGVVLAVMAVENMRVQQRRKTLSINPDEKSYFTAARRGSLSTLRASLARGQRVDAIEPAHGRTALMRAAGFDHLDAVKLLLEAGAKPAVLDFEGRNALHVAAEAGAADVIPPLMSAGANPGVPSPDGSRQRTALGLAVRGGQTSAVKALVLAGANPNDAGAREPPPIETAIENRRPDIVQALLLGKPSLRPAAGRPTKPLLLLAVQSCDGASLDLVRMLVEGGADTQVRDEKGRTALEVAETADARYQNVECYPPIIAYLRQPR